MRRKIASAIVTALMALGFTIAVAPGAQAATWGVNLGSVCLSQYAWDDYALLGNNVMSWKCVVRGSGGTIIPLGGLDINRWCGEKYGAVAKYSDFNNPYSWYCYR